MTMVCNVKGMFVEKGSYVKKGTTILEAQPFVFVLSSEFRGQFCDNCLKKRKVSKCSACQYVYYCSRNCQKQSWPIHKIKCPNFKKLYPIIIPDTANILANIIIKLANGGDQERGYYSENEYKTYDDLMSHYSNIREDTKRLEHFTTLRVVLEEFLPSSLIPKPVELLKMYGKLSINSFHIMEATEQSIGVGIYLGPSVIDHSCKPTVGCTFDGTKLTLSATVDIPSFDMSKARTSYIALMNTAEDRRAELQSMYYFWCECGRCTNPDPVETGALCPNKSCASLCSPTDGSCKKCGIKFPEDFRFQFEHVTKISRRCLTLPQDPSHLDSYRKCLNKQEGLFHPFNILRGRVMERLLNMCISFNMEKEIQTYMAEMRPILVYYFNGYR